MEFGWLLQGAVSLFGQLPSWLRDPGPDALAVLAGASWSCSEAQYSCATAGGGGEVRAERVRDEATLLKDRLRQCLSEPATLFASGVNTAPTMGACEAFEGDIEAVARTVLVEAGGHRAKAKQLLRKRMSGHGAANGKLNGSEVSYWRQLGALSLLDGIADALPAYARAADLAPENAEAQMLAGVLYLRAGNLDAAEAAFRRQIKLGNALNGGTTAVSRAIAATPCWATCWPRARSTTRRRPLTRKRSARSRRCSSAMRSTWGSGAICP